MVFHYNIHAVTKFQGCIDLFCFVLFLFVCLFVCLFLFFGLFVVVVVVVFVVFCLFVCCCWFFFFWGGGGVNHNLYKSHSVVRLSKEAVGQKRVSFKGIHGRGNQASF